VYAIYDLCLHPEYLTALRQEIAEAAAAAVPAGAEPDVTKIQLDESSLPLLDSFLRESARLNPLESSEC
jgi:hypothetical protein